MLQACANLKLTLRQSMGARSEKQGALRTHVAIGSSKPACWKDLIAKARLFCSRLTPSLGAALPLRKAYSDSATILDDKLNAGFLQCGHKGLSSFGATTDLSLGGLQPLDSWRRYAGTPR
ncbi:hypothetical protein M2175_004333 [Bradyrhizobium elkanii]|nr:hypothetical protein [Bradyrhizobium elkanii]MCS3969858.1 hypothetical protein [Bradyrhizobium japonicum]